jgi:hypothetical protein
LVSRFLFPFNVFYFSVGQFNSLFSNLFRALAKNSSFGFLALAFVSAKTKCAVCAAGFFSLLTTVFYKICATEKSKIFPPEQILLNVCWFVLNPI